MARALNIKKQARPRPPKGSKLSLQSIKHLVLGDDVFFIAGKDSQRGRNHIGTIQKIIKVKGKYRAIVSNSSSNIKHTPDGREERPVTININNLRRVNKVENPRHRKIRNIGGRPLKTKELLALYGDIGRDKDNPREKKPEA